MKWQWEKMFTLKFSHVISTVCDTSHREGYQCTPSHTSFLRDSDSLNKRYLDKKSLSVCIKLLFVDNGTVYFSLKFYSSSH